MMNKNSIITPYQYPDFALEDKKRKEQQGALIKILQRQEELKKVYLRYLEISNAVDILKGELTIIIEDDFPVLEKQYHDLKHQLDQLSDEKSIIQQSKEDVNKEFRKKIKEVHPDRNPSNPEASSKTIEVSKLRDEQLQAISQDEDLLLLKSNNIQKKIENAEKQLEEKIQEKNFKQQNIDQLQLVKKRLQAQYDEYLYLISTKQGKNYPSTKNQKTTSRTTPLGTTVIIDKII